MTADEIRETNYGEVAYLREIAAQLAELNQNIKLLRPVDEEMSVAATEAYEAEDEDLKEQESQFQELLASPTSDPEKFTRCSECAKEIDRPAWCEVGKTIMCDECIPF